MRRGDGNSDIAPLSDVQVFANNRRFARTRYSERAMLGLGAERSRLHALTVMCGGALSVWCFGIVRSRDATCASDGEPP